MLYSDEEEDHLESLSKSQIFSGPASHDYDFSQVLIQCYSFPPLLPTLFPTDSVPICFLESLSPVDYGWLHFPPLPSLKQERWKKLQQVRLLSASWGKVSELCSNRLFSGKEASVVEDPGLISQGSLPLTLPERGGDLFWILMLKILVDRVPRRESPQKYKVTSKTMALRNFLFSY